MHNLIGVSKNEKIFIIFIYDYDIFFWCANAYGMWLGEPKVVSGVELTNYDNLCNLDNINNVIQELFKDE